MTFKQVSTLHQYKSYNLTFQMYAFQGLITVDFQLKIEYGLVQWNIDHCVIIFFVSPGSLELQFIPIGTSTALASTLLGFFGVLELVSN